MTEALTQEQQEYIAKLEKEKQIFDQILDKDPKGMVISEVEKENLRSLNRRAGKVLEKLKNREFTVAVVGLEKAGKSTLANAILKLNALPEYTERCTYTTTEIRAGQANEAEVYFYSQSEFQSKLQDMLNTLEFPHAVDLHSLSESLFNAYWERQREEKPLLYQAHNGTIAEDIRAIIKGKDIIRQLLGQKAMKFSEDALGSQDFQKFITGISGYDTDHTVIRTQHPYAVSKVIIRSSNLNEMRNIVLYDVPGFDSPTKLHKEQTEQMLKEADAIILVTNVGDRPNLTGPQLDMLHKVRDDDGIRLSAKAFVFGNKIDRAANAQVAKDNESALRKDVRRYELAEENHILCGSAKGYLERVGIGSSDERTSGDMGISQTLQAWGMDDGIEHLKTQMQNYYEHDRFEVLKERAEKNIADAKEFMEEILSKLTPAKLNQMYLGHDIVLTMHDDLDTFIKKAVEIRENVQRTCWEEQPFSKTVEAKIEEIFPDIDPEKELASIHLTGDVDLIDRLRSKEARIREKLQVEFLANLVKEMAAVTKVREEAINESLVQAFLEAMGMQEGSVYKQELEESVRELFFKKVLVSDSERCHFDSLVERFSTSIIEALIGHPMGSEERYQKIFNDEPPQNSRQEFLSLAVYYRDPEEKLTDALVKELSIFSRILLHRDTQKDLYRENDQSLQGILKDNRRLLKNGAEVASEFVPMGHWAKVFLKAGLHLKDHEEALRSTLSDATHSDDWEKRTDEEKQKLLNTYVERYCRNRPMQSGMNLSNILEKMQEEARNTIRVDSQEKMFAYLIEDVQILRDITVNSVRYAMGLERAFISVMSKNIDIICKSIEDKKKPNHALYNQWIDANWGRIHESGYAHIAQEQEDRATREGIVNAMKSLLKQSK